LDSPELPDFATQEECERYMLMHHKKTIRIAKNYQQWCKPAPDPEKTNIRNLIDQVIKITRDGYRELRLYKQASEKDGGICCCMHQKYIWPPLHIPSMDDDSDHPDTS
jgi:hypothetical protein